MRAEPCAFTGRDGLRTAFRSKLEARWAHYFDTMALPWKYEPYRAEMKNGLVYTPDFEVDGIGVIEIKPYWGALADSATRIEAFVQERGERVHLFYGQSPFRSNIAILSGIPLSRLVLDHMQETLLLCGKQAHERAKENYHAVQQYVSAALVAASAKIDFDMLSVQEIMLLSDTRPG